MKKLLVLVSPVLLSACGVFPTDHCMRSYEQGEVKSIAITRSPIPTIEVSLYMPQGTTQLCRGVYSKKYDILRVGNSYSLTELNRVPL